MTNQELNRDILKLGKAVLKIRDNKQHVDVNTEFKRLYYADNKATVLTLKSLKIMMVINRIYRIIPFHLFYIDMDI
jgi:hypothetical protein